MKNLSKKILAVSMLSMLCTMKCWADPQQVEIGLLIPSAIDFRGTSPVTYTQTAEGAEASGLTNGDKFGEINIKYTTNTAAILKAEYGDGGSMKDKATGTPVTHYSLRYSNGVTALPHNATEGVAANPEGEIKWHVHLNGENPGTGNYTGLLTVSIAGA